MRKVVRGCNASAPGAAERAGTLACRWLRDGQPVGNVAGPAPPLTVATPCRPDLNADGEWTFDDVALFIGLSTAGC